MDEQWRPLCKIFDELWGSEERCKTPQRILGLLREGHRAPEGAAHGRFFSAQVSVRPPHLAKGCGGQ